MDYWSIFQQKIPYTLMIQRKKSVRKENIV